MEFVEISEGKKFSPAVSVNQRCQPKNVKHKRKYVQPPRAENYAPKTIYCPPKNSIDSKTTYYSSYYNENQTCNPRPEPIKPKNNINLPEDKFFSDTTTKLSFQPVWGVYRAKPILPRQRLGVQKGQMECQTTIRKDFSPKFAPRQKMIIPCGNIRTSKGLINATTTTCLSYMNPGLVKPVSSYKPKLKYCRPLEPAATETTQKLSFPPFEVGKKENYPWAQKPVYRPPETVMPDETTYKKSYLENKVKKECPLVPKDAGVFPSGAEFFDSTIYKESFLPCRTEPVLPILPCPKISLSQQKMICETTNKLSYQAVKGEKRKPIMPRPRKILSDVGSMQNVTTNQLEYGQKIGTRVKPVVPCANIRTSGSPIEDKTVTSLSYANPGPLTHVKNFKPVMKYCKPNEKLEAETVNKLSYPKWSIGPKENLPWAQKQPYEPPKDKMPDTSIYHLSFPAPGYYVEEPDDAASCSCNDNQLD